MGSKAAKRYAKALFGLCREDHTLDAVLKDLLDLRQLAAAYEDLDSFMSNPMVPAEKRGDVLDQLLAGKAHPATLRFLHFLEAKSRLLILPQIIPLFEDLVHDHRGILSIKIHAASPLADDQLEQIKTRMKARFERLIEATVTIDPTLIGGFKVRVGDTIHDYSISTQLEMLKHQLITT